MNSSSNNHHFAVVPATGEVQGEETDIAPDGGVGGW